MDVNDLTRGLGPVTSVVFAVLLVILGILVISVPSVLPWLVGIALILAGTAVVVAVLVPGRRTV